MAASVSHTLPWSWWVSCVDGSSVSRPSGWGAYEGKHIPSLSKSHCTHELSGPVLRDTARLSQRYPPYYALWGFWRLNMANWVRYPPPRFLSVPPWRACEVEVRYPPPQKGYLSDIGAIPYENKAKACDTPLCDTISEGYCAIWGGISHWAAKRMKLLFLNCLGDDSYSFQGSSELISITDTVSLFFLQNGVTGKNSPQEFPRIFGNYSYMI